MHIVWVEEFIAFFFRDPSTEKIINLAFFHEVLNIDGMRLFACKVSKTVCIFIVPKVVPVNLKTGDLRRVLGKETKVRRICMLDSLHQFWIQTQRFQNLTSALILFFLDFAEHHATDPNAKNIYGKVRTLDGNWFTKFISTYACFHLEHHLYPRASFLEMENIRKNDELKDKVVVIRKNLRL